MWGGFLVSNTINEEIRNGTWDNQRLSPISPWKMTIGKLFGSALYTWYGSIIMLIIYAYSSLRYLPTSHVMYNLSMLILSGIFCHLVALLITTQSIKSKKLHKSSSSIAALIVSLIASGYFYLKVFFSKAETVGVNDIVKSLAIIAYSGNKTVFSVVSSSISDVPR